MNKAVIEFDEKALTTFSVSDQALKELIEEGKEIDPHVNYDQAKDFLKTCTSLRGALEDERKQKKSGILAAGRAIDAEAKRIREVIEGVESPIKSKKKEIDDEAARIEAERVLEIDKRMLQITLDPGRVHQMTRPQVEHALTALKEITVTHDDFQERYHEAEDQYAKTGSMLKTRLRQIEEAEQREAELKAERERLAEQRKEMEAEQEKRDAEERERRKAQAEKDRKLQEEREEIERQKRELEKEKREAAERQEAEAKAEAERERIAELAPDREKLERLAKDLKNFKLPRVKSDAAQTVILSTRTVLDAGADAITAAIGESFQ